MKLLFLCAALLICASPGQAGCGDEKMPQSIKEVKSRYERQLLKKPGVVSVGIGLDSQGEKVIVIGLDRPRPETEKILPDRLGPYKVRSEVIGQVKAK